MKRGVRSWLLMLFVLCTGVGAYLVGVREVRNRLFYEDVETLRGPRRALITPLDYFATGKREVDAFLRRQPERRKRGFHRILTDSMHSIVRVRIGSTSTTGVLVPDGTRVLALTPAGLQSDVPVTVVSLSGRVFVARVRTTDPLWMILELEASPDGLEPVRCGSATTGELAACLAYPRGIGENSAGHLVHDSPELPGFLKPLMTIGRVLDSELTPAAGWVPLSEDCGGPVFNLNGELIGLLTRVQTLAEGHSVEYSYELLDLGML